MKAPDVIRKVVLRKMEVLAPALAQSFPPPSRLNLVSNTSGIQMQMRPTRETRFDVHTYNQ